MQLMQKVRFHSAVALGLAAVRTLLRKKAYATAI